MGVDLRLMPLLMPNSCLAHDMIDLNKDYQLWRAIGNLPQADIPRDGIWSFMATGDDGESAYGITKEDPYGNPLKTVTSTALLTLADLPSVVDRWRTRAAWAYIAQMPEEWPIVLYWH